MKNVNKCSAIIYKGPRKGDIYGSNGKVIDIINGKEEWHCNNHKLKVNKEKKEKKIEIHGINEYDLEKNKSYINIEKKIIYFLEKEIYLRDTLKPKIYEYGILKYDQCNCEQEINIKINEESFIKEDIINILEIIKNEYNDKELQKKISLIYKCELEQIDLDGNVYKFFFKTMDNNYEFPDILVHCYSWKKRKNIYICLHIQYLSILNIYNDKSYNYESHIYIKY